MKYIIAVIQPHRLDPVREALGGVGVQGLTVSEVRGFGRQKGQTEIYRGAEYVMQFVPKIKLEIAVDDEIADRCGAPVIAARHPAPVVQALLYDGPLAVRGDDEAVEVDLKAVGDRIVVDARREPAGPDQCFAVEAAALREKVRGLEMLTRNRVTNEEIDRQFEDVLAQIRRVDRMTVEQDVKEPLPARPLSHPDPEH